MTMHVPIALAADDRYAAHLAVTIVSCLENAHRDNRYEFIVLDGGITPENQAKLTEMVARYPHGTVRFLDFNGKMSHVLTTHLPLATFFRLLLPDLLPEYGTLLYLDADTIALTDVAELFATDLGEACVAAVPDLHVNGFIRDGATNYLHRTAYRDMNWTGYAVKLLGLDPADPGYFNAGVALLDLARIRSEGLDKAMLAFLEKHQPLALCDQDVMNAVLARKKRLLPLEWNIKGDLLHPLWPARQVRAAMRHPRILHYRFWQYGTPLSGHYWRYLALTPFAGTVKRGLFSYPLIYAPAKVSHSLWKALRGCIRSKKS